jgi:hypothetical protein
VLLPQQRTEEVKHIKRLLDTLYADPTEIYGVKNPMDVADLFKSTAATESPKSPKSAKATKVISFDELMQNYTKRPFNSWDEFAKFTDEHLAVYTQSQRQAFIQKVLEHQPDLANRVGAWKK